MALESGTRLSHYEITDQIGKGGMGEVYRARDTKLGREVAIKVLPSEFSRDEERLARLEREARMLAALNHPNIAAIYGLEQTGDTRFLVLELVEGDTLADRLQRGAIPVEDSLKLALQMAEALEAAHEKGVVHRDLKPANIKVTPDGKVKVLDFGLAKAFAGEQPDANLSNSPTLSMQATQAGIILGTVAYMSPEQAKGRPVDERTDVWAFGCVVYEMFTGGPVFGGEDVTTILARVVDREPDFALLPKLHPKLSEVLRRCLQKDAGRRYRHIGDARLDIESVLSDPRGVVVEPVETTHAAPQSRLPWIGAVVLAAVITALATRSFQAPIVTGVVRFTHVLAADDSLTRHPLLARSPIAISPDGSRIVYTANQQLYMRAVGELDAFPIRGTDERPWTPVFSPDGEWLAYWSGGDEEIKKIPADGGASQTVARVEGIPAVGGPAGLLWDTLDTLVYSFPNVGEFRVASGGGEPEAIGVTRGSNANIVFTASHLLEEQGVILGTLGRGLEAVVAARPLDAGGEARTFFEGANPRYLPTGHLVYARAGALYAVGFDPDTLETVGQPVLVVDGVDAWEFAVSGAGTLAYIPGVAGAATGSAARTVVWVDGNGNEELIPAEAQPYTHVRVSPDGQELALRIEAGSSAGLYTWTVGAGPLRQFVPGDVGSFEWVSNEDIAFVLADESETVYRRSLDSPVVDHVCCESPISGTFGFLTLARTQNGNALATAALKIESDTQAATAEIGLISSDGEYTALMERSGVLALNAPTISPQGTHVAYMDGTQPGGLITVRELPDIDTTSILVGAGLRPVWSADGSELYFERSGAILAARVRTEPSFTYDAPVPVVPTAGYFDPGAGRMWDVAPDGRLVMIKPAAGVAVDEAIEPDSPRINIVVNWTEELLERVPVE